MPNGISRAVIEVLLDRVHEGAATLSPEGEITYANQRLASMLGQSRGLLVGKRFAELVADGERDALAAALEGGHDTASQCRLALPRANGQGALRALVTFAPLGHGQSSCLVSDLAQGRQVAGLAHEVRNMLGAMRNSLEILRRAALEPDARRAVESIERQSGKVLELMEELRRVSPRE